MLSPSVSVSLFVAWCLRNEGVSSVLLGTSNPTQLTENLGAIQASNKAWLNVPSDTCFRFSLVAVLLIKKISGAEKM